MMKELLFENIIEKEAFENILALNQIRKCDKEIEQYSTEINNLNSEMKEILKSENIHEDYVEKIHKYKSVLNNLEGDNGRIYELETTISENETKIAEYQAAITETEDSLESLKRKIFETDDPSIVIDCQNEIENKNVLLNELNETLNKLISDNTPLLIEREYLSAKNNGNDSNIPSFNKQEIKTDLERLMNVFNEEISKLSLPIRENIEFCQKKIKNRELEIEKFQARKASVIESFPNSVDLNIEKAYEDISKLLEELNLTERKNKYEDTSIFDELEEEIEEPEQTDEIVENKENSLEVEKEEPKKEDIKDEMVLLEDDSVEVEPVEENIEVPAVEEPVKETEEETPVEEEKIVETEDKAETTEEIPVIEEPKVESAELETTETEEVGSVSYVLSDGESLVNIAEKVYPSKDNWEAIYYFNKDAIDKFLISNGISDDFDTIKEIANDTSLFTGIKLEIPTDYNYKI